MISGENVPIIGIISLLTRKKKESGYFHSEKRITWFTKIMVLGYLPALKPWRWGIIP